MDHQDVVKKVAQATGIEPAVCEGIIGAYEKYCEENAQVPFKKEIAPELLSWVSASTGTDQAIVESVIKALIANVRQEISRKIPFMK